ncbi:30S ribosomal protein S8 [Vermiphilus pyriformis]|jgi:small subunit ribosomal protein S8|uniref:Small ribosomal subunit protein uS8 n=1 Tax=candidate division TM6 bacterium JCVI TM6SC1 TaxID=1306947 RepID=A0A0D2GPL5_9BACT|nr:hypothetical protein J120_03265 [candidate division TM6 bacterium JCVI TM6SC1]UNE35377.1 MAG: 30S ribosomal protein S8 [Vermiphilus pyriformis]
MSVDAIGNFLTIIRNGLMASKSIVTAPYSRMKAELARVLIEEGFIKDAQIITDDTGKKHIKILLKYVDGESVIHEIKRISTPGRRIYRSIDNVKPVIGGLGISILTTSAGLMTHKQAKQRGIGGEIICSVW